MSLRPGRVSEVPEETARVARAAFPKGCLAMRMRDVLGQLFTDTEFAPLFPSRGKPAFSPALLALVSVLQFTGGLSDRQAAHAVRARIDWKYALGLELDDAGFDHSVLCEFRARLVAGGMEQRVLDAVLEASAAAGLLKPGGRQRSDSTHVLAAVRDLNRLEFLTETVRAALNVLAVAAPDWLTENIEPEWFDRYSARPEDTQQPTRWAARIKHGDQVGADGMALLRAATTDKAPSWLRELPAVEVLRLVWVQQYEIREEHVCLRKPDNIPAGQHRYRSPYDPDTRVGGKRDMVWAGYKVHLTETCEPDDPHLITNVTTTNAAIADITMTTTIHSGLAERGLLPDEHLVDAGYVDAEQIIQAKEDHNIELVGPVARDTTRQKATDGAYDNTHFHIDWNAKSVTCPDGKTSAYWQSARSHRGTRSQKSASPPATAAPAQSASTAQPRVTAANSPSGPLPSTRSCAVPGRSKTRRNGASATSCGLVSRALSPKGCLPLGYADPGTEGWTKPDCNTC